MTYHIPPGWTQGGEVWTEETHPELFRVLKEARERGHLIPANGQFALEWKDVRDDAHRIQPEDTGRLRGSFEDWT